MDIDDQKSNFLKQIAIFMKFETYLRKMDIDDHK